MNPVTWIVAADRSRARFFEMAPPDGAWTEHEALEHPRARLHDRDLNTDEPGVGRDSGGRGRHPMTAAVSPKQEEAREFARRLCDRLERAADRGGFQRLVLVAPPAFLGVVRRRLGPNTRRLLATTLAKELSQQPVHVIRAALGLPAQASRPFVGALAGTA